jgi:hypothetical protein
VKWLVAESWRKSWRKDGEYRAAERRREDGAKSYKWKSGGLCRKNTEDYMRRLR